MTAPQQPTEVFEVVDRITGKRWQEVIFLSAGAAFEWVHNVLPERDHRVTRVQSVAVHPGPHVYRKATP